MRNFCLAACKCARMPLIWDRAVKAPVAQLDRAPDFESGGQGFESLPARHGLSSADRELQDATATDNNHTADRALLALLIMGSAAPAQDPARHGRALLKEFCANCHAIGKTDSTRLHEAPPLR